MADAATWMDALALFLQDNGLGTMGTDLWVGRMSDDTTLPDSALILTPVPGRTSLNMGSGGDIDRPMVNVFVRGAAEDYPGAFNRVWAAWNALRQVPPGTVHGWYFQSVGSDGGPTPTSLGRDGNRRPQFTVDMETWQPAQDRGGVIVVA